MLFCCKKISIANLRKVFLQALKNNAIQNMTIMGYNKYWAAIWVLIHVLYWKEGREIMVDIWFLWNLFVENRRTKFHIMAPRLSLLPLLIGRAQKQTPPTVYFCNRSAVWGQLKVWEQSARNLSVAPANNWLVELGILYSLVQIVKIVFSVGQIIKIV